MNQSLCLKSWETLKQPSPPLRPHLGQHSPAGMNGLWSPKQVSWGQGRALQVALPLEQTHTEQGEGLHWLSCCGNQRSKEMGHLLRGIQKEGGQKRKKKRQRDEESRFILRGLDKFVSLSLSDRRGKGDTRKGWEEWEVTKGDYEKSRNGKYKRECVNVDVKAHCKMASCFTAEQQMSNFSLGDRKSVQLKMSFTCLLRYKVSLCQGLWFYVSVFSSWVVSSEFIPFVFF